MGGGVALNIADIAPDRVASLTMLSGIGVQSTSRGLMTGRSAAREGVGGEILCNVW
jgi:ribosomal protein S8